MSAHRSPAQEVKAEQHTSGHPPPLPSSNEQQQSPASMRGDQQDNLSPWNRGGIAGAVGSSDTAIRSTSAIADQQHSPQASSSSHRPSSHSPSQARQKQDSSSDHRDTAATAAAIAAMGSLAGQPGRSDHSTDAAAADGHLEDMDEDDDGPQESNHAGPSRLPLGTPSPTSSTRKGSTSGGGGGGGGKSTARPPETERQRKDLHKEVERKRRAGINAAISELQSLLPSSSTTTEGSKTNPNKESIIVRAAEYIRELKMNEGSNIEKWTLEKLLMDQAMNDLGMQLEASRQEVQRLRERFGIEEEEEEEEVEEDDGEHWAGGAAVAAQQHAHSQQQQGQDGHQSHNLFQHDRTTRTALPPDTSAYASPGQALGVSSEVESTEVSGSKRGVEAADVEEESVNGGDAALRKKLRT